jgi:alkylation response protein AidB-like acyl-CoA dehydrogenase
MTTRADRRGDRYIINGRKHWITGGGVSKLHLIFARVFDERGEALGVGGFLAVRDEAKEAKNGLRIVRREKTMGLRGIPEGELAFENLEVPAGMAVIPPSGFKRGFAELMNAYNSQRVGAGSVAMGIAAGALELAIDFVKSREQFGRPIGEFQGLQWMLADMQIQLTASRLMLHAAARSRGQAGDNVGAFPDPMLAAQAKIFASEAAIKIVNDALQMFGARGYSRELPLERMARDVRMFTIGGGTAQVLRTLVASRLLGWKLPQTREGYLKDPARPLAAE